MRLIQGNRGWWALGPKSVALVPSSAVTADGELTREAVDHLETRDFFQQPEDDTYYLTVLTATSCNLGCSYCFQNVQPAANGQHNPVRIRSATLSVETTQYLLTFTRDKMRAAGRKRLHILLFGGEPLLNVEGTLNLLRSAASAGLRSAEMVTNGTLLTPQVAADLAAAGLSRLQITFDGDAASHDTLRVTRAGRPTYERILGNVRRAARSADLEWILRVNIADPDAIDLEPLLADLATAVSPERATISLHLIDDIGVGYDGPALHWQQVADRFVDWYATAADRGFRVPIAVSRRSCVYCSSRAGQSGAVVNADGVLYSCWESAGKPGWEVGDVRGGYLPDDLLDGRWVSCGYEARPRWSANDQRRFADRIDAANLDRLLQSSVA